MNRGAPSALSIATIRTDTMATILRIKGVWQICFDYLRPKLLDLFQNACCKRELLDVQWLWSLGFTLVDVRAGNNEALRRASANGHLATAQWLWGLGLTLADVRAENNEALRWAS